MNVLTTTISPAQQGIEQTHHLPLLFHLSELPGQMCIRKLENAGILTHLDERTSFPSTYASSIFGRAQIAARMAPIGSTVCAILALWVWIGGEIPDTITIISGSHYRAPIFGRNIQAFNRQIGPNNMMRIGKLSITNPLWTACELACLPPEEFSQSVGTNRLMYFLQQFDISLDECRAFLGEKTRWPGHNFSEPVIAAIEAMC